MTLLPFAPLQFLFHRLADELPALVRTCDSVDARHHVGGEPNGRHNGFDVSLERRATHPAVCARLHCQRQIDLRNVNAYLTCIAYTLINVKSAFDREFARLASFLNGH